MGMVRLGNIHEPDTKNESERVGVYPHGLRTD